MRHILFVLFCFLAVQPCIVGNEPILTVPASDTPLHLFVPLPNSIRPDAPGHWQLVEIDNPGNTIAVQIVPAMTAEGIASESAFCMMANIPPRKDAPAMRNFFLLPTTQDAVANPAFQIQELNDKSLKILEGQSPVFVYNYGEITNEKVPAKDTRRTRACYVHPVWGLQGEVLTDDFPKDHYHHHGIFWAWPHVGIGDKQYDLWKYTHIKQEFVRWICRQSGPAGAVLAVENGWFADGKKVMIERCWLSAFSADEQSRSIDFQFVFIPVDNPITLRGAEGKSYGGLNMRFAVKDEKEAVITVPDGVAKKDLLETPLPWADLTYPFTSPSTPSGAAMFVSPEHPDYPPTWVTRHFGPLFIGWPGVKDKTFPPGQPIHLNYRVWIHKSAVSLADLEKAYAAYVLKNKGEWKN
jgi:hypothetical protein